MVQTKNIEDIDMDTGSKSSNKPQMLREMLAGVRDRADLKRLIEALENEDIDGAVALLIAEDATPHSAKQRIPGRFKGRLTVGPEFFEPLDEKDIRELSGK